MAKAFITRIIDINLVGENYSIQLEVQKVATTPDTQTLYVNAPWGSDWRYHARQAVIAQFPDVDGVVFPDLTTL